MRSVLVAAACGLVLAACATITKGGTQVVAVNTPGVPGATCTLSNTANGSRVVITPGTMTLEKSKDAISVRCTKDCYADGAGILSSSFEPMTAGNILLGGFIGLGVDAASGAMNNYAPDIQVLMTPTPGCRPAGEPQPPPARKPKAT